MGEIIALRARSRRWVSVTLCSALVVGVVGYQDGPAASMDELVTVGFAPTADTYVLTERRYYCPDSGDVCMPDTRPPRGNEKPPRGNERDLKLGYKVIDSGTSRTISTYRPIMRFEVPAVPEGYQLRDAVLEVSVQGDTTPPLELLQISSAWSENTTTSPSTISTPVAVTSLVSGVRQEIDVTPAAVGWLADPAANHGLMFSPARVPHATELASREARLHEQRPTVTFTFEPIGAEDDIPPTVVFTAPDDGQMVWGTVTVAADAFDDVAVDRVVFQVGREVMATVTAPPYAFDWDTSEVPDGEHLVTAVAHDRAGNQAQAHRGVLVANDATVAEQLDADYASGRIDVDTYVLQALYSVLGDPELDERYVGEQLDEASAWLFGALSHWDALDEATQQTIESFFTPIVEVDPNALPERASAGATVLAASVGPAECGWRVRLDWANLAPWFDCRVAAGDTYVWWNSGSTPSPPGGGLPEVVAGYADGFAAAGEHFDGLEYRSVGTTHAYVVNPGSTGVSLPIGSTMLMPQETGSPGWFAAHELFHQYQYRYLGIAGWRSGGGPLGAPDSVLWWMEASAEWAAHQVLAENPHLVGRFSYASKIDAFFEDSERSLDHFRPIELGRQYGAFVVAEWLHANGGATGPDADVIRRVWEEMNLLTTPVVAFGRALPDGFGRQEIARMWRDLYFLDIDIPDRVDAAETSQWRANFPADIPPYLERRPAARQILGLRAGDSHREEFRLERAAGTFIEVEPLDAGLLTVEVIDTTGRVEVGAYALASYDTSPTSSPDECTETSIEAVTSTRTRITVPNYDPAHCAGLSIIVSKDDQLPASQVTAVVSLGDRVDTTIENGVIRLGINAEGHLNVPGFEPSSGTGTTTVGLRYLPTSADALAPGCHCEGWGVADVVTGVAGWANQDEGGAFGLVVEEAQFDERSGVSQVVAADRLRVRHEFSPAPQTPNLYRIDVTIEHAGRLGSGLLLPITPAYRRTMDWDVEPTAFSEYVTIQPTSIRVPSELVFTSNDGFATSNPLGPRTDLGATGFFADYGPSDQGALIDLQFAQLLPGESVSFTMWYGAADNETDALQAISAVDAQLYSLAQPDVPGGAETGEPNTFIWAYRGPDDTSSAVGADFVTKQGTQEQDIDLVQQVEDYHHSLPPSTTRNDPPSQHGG
jgi:hypothetical protein